MIQYNNFLMKREQSRAGSRFAECEKSRLKAKILITLALLLTAVTGAWAQTVTVTWTLTDLQANPDVTTFTKDGVTLKCDTRISSGKSFVGPVTFSNTLGNFTKIEITGTSSAPITAPEFTNNDKVSTWTGNAASISTPASIAYATQFVFTIAPAEAPITVVPVAGKTNEWTFTQPGSDVVLTPQYAPTAKWATEGDAVLAPTALEGIIAGTTDAIVKAGTVVEGQGTVMYAVTSTNQATAPELSAFSATLPTAANIADDGATVYVWYFIKGTDTPDGQEATAENTFNDSEICAQPLEVIVLSNKFDITFNAANANTIEAGKATVTVGGTAATVTDGKLQGVKMGSEVKVKANTGYKFRKVEVKKGAKSLIVNPVVGQIIGSDGKNYAYGSLPTGVTAVAKICYVSGSNGLALALTDEESKMNWSTAIETCAAHTPAITGGTWKLATKDEWSNMITAAGSHTALRDGFSSVGGTNMKEDYPYWSSTEDGSDNVWIYSFSYGIWSKNNNSVGYVRACLAF